MQLGQLPFSMDPEEVGPDSSRHVKGTRALEVAKTIGSMRTHFY